MIWRNRELPFVGTWSIAIVTVVGIFLVASHEAHTWPFQDRRPLRERYAFSPVVRIDLNPIVNAPGRLESSKRTLIRCELENTSGTRAVGTGSSTMLSLLPEGTAVKKGDVLATLDASTYEDMYQQQTITVEQAKASYLQVELGLEVALLSVRQFQDGTIPETLKSLEGAIALARSDLSRATDHLGWTERMKDKGYSSVAQIRTEQHGVSQLDFSLQKQLMSLELFQRFTKLKTEKTLAGQVTAAQTNLNNEKLRLQRQLDRLELLKKQVDRCTVRAPHDGILYYYKDSNPRGNNRSPTLIEEGMSVRQRQPLFYLPDLAEMEVQVAINESIVDRIKPGLRARVRFEAFPDLAIDGNVVSIAQVPAGLGRDGEDFRYFISIVKLDSVAPGLRPGMSTRVDIALPPRENVLAIPHQAVKLDSGRKVCFVAQDESLDRREVRIGQETTDMVEVLGGLEEGDLVALDPPAPLRHVQPLIKFDEIDLPPAADTDTVAAPQR
jgi:HlyD family secretion protein